jgi:hypothetical protein
MVALLTETEVVRLRKRYLATSTPGRWLVTIGEKGKREVNTWATEGHAVDQVLTDGLSADISFHPTNRNVSSRSQSQSQIQPDPALIYTRTGWPSSFVDGINVTPSLTSDGDAEQGLDEPLPPTPPQVPTVAIASPEEEEALPPSSPPVLPTDFSAACSSL